MGRRIYLVGYMGSGKSTAGRKLAKLLGWSFTDLDSMIENRFRISIPDIFGRFDEAAFRKMEHETLKLTFDLHNHVISTGGGTPCFFNNMDIINKNGISVYLELTPKALHNRLVGSKKKRPLLENHPPGEVLGFIEEQLESRRLYYERAHYTVKGENFDVEELKELINLQKINP
jgi:shikimate kinase